MSEAENNWRALSSSPMHYGYETVQEGCSASLLADEAMETSMQEDDAAQDCSKIDHPPLDMPRIEVGGLPKDIPVEVNEYSYLATNIAGSQCSFITNLYH